MVCNYLYGLIFLLCVSLLFDVSTFHCERPYLALYSACAIFHMANSNESSEKYFWGKQAHGDVKTKKAQLTHNKRSDSIIALHPVLASQDPTSGHSHPAELQTLLREFQKFEVTLSRGSLSKILYSLQRRSQPTWITLPYWMTVPSSFLFSVSFCFFSKSAACWN